MGGLYQVDGQTDVPSPPPVRAPTPGNGARSRGNKVLRLSTKGVFESL